MKREEWITPYVHTYFRRFILIAALGTLAALAAGSLMFTSGYLISKAALRPENILLIYVPIVAVRTFGIGRAVLHYVERLVGHDTILRVLADMRVKLYRVLEPQALFIRSRYRTGDILGVLSDDIEQLQNVYIRTLFPGVTAVAIAGMSVWAIGRFDGWFALLMAVYLVVLIVILPYLSLRIATAKTIRLKQMRSKLYQKLTDAVLGIGDWVISGRTREFVESYEKDQQETARLERSLHRWTRRRNGAAQLIVGIAAVSMLFWTGVLHAEGLMNGTLIAAFVLVVFSLADVFVPLSEAVQNVSRYRDSFSRLASVGGPVEGESAVRPLTAEEDEEGIRKARRIAEEGTDIRLDRVSFRYGPQEEWALKDLSLHIPQGRKIAIIGRSGGGKSTLLKLLQGALKPTEGSVTVSGESADVLSGHMSHVIAVLNQNPHLFDATVASNIRLGNRGASDEDIRRAAKQVRLDGLIESLPEGYHTPMLETGQRFSGGERQRIALARILLQDTPAVILDEPTVGLDPRTEKDLLATIFETVRGKTLIWVTHHLVGAEHMDEIIFMENGTIEMRGSHDDLMAEHPRYRRLYELDRPGWRSNHEPVKAPVR